jgi:hypothetical protein
MRFMQAPRKTTHESPAIWTRDSPNPRPTATGLNTAQLMNRTQYPTKGCPFPQFSKTLMNLKSLGMFNATRLADAEFFSALFGITPDQFLETSDAFSNESGSLCWHAEPFYEDELAWHVHVVAGDTLPELSSGVPKPIELHQFARGLLRESGRGASFYPRIIPYCGGLLRFGEMLIEPNSLVVRSRSRRRGPQAVLRKALRSKKYENCELMYGMAMCPRGHWTPHIGSSEQMALSWNRQTGTLAFSA